MMLNNFKIDEDARFANIVLADSERQPCEIWTRVMGYFRPVSAFNKGKKSEFKKRKCFTEAKALVGMENIKIQASLDDGCSCVAAE